MTVSALARYEAASHDRRFHTLGLALLADRRGLDGNDDDLWVAEAALDMAELEADPAHRRDAAMDAAGIFDRLAADYWDTTCGGGLWWDHARTYKNAITNALFIDVAARLYGATGTSRYKGWAMKGWRWFDASGMIAASHEVNDGLDARCRNNGGVPYSYNQGVILDALRRLSVLTGDRRLLDEAARIARKAIDARGTPAGGFREAQEPMSVDSRIFRGIFAQALGRLAPALPPGEDRRHVGAWLRDQSAHLWKTRSPAALFNATWDRTAFRPSAQAQVTAADLFVAAARASGERAR
ncbi:glycoside hydrolase family 76 protein [Gluconacetobacter sacchari]|uniref:glycoside hydrolase family 76 protein n=1 Tax=Gluconacetobacter sacchari TaxID=92759 RepID=UPI0039B53BA3